MIIIEQIKVEIERRKGICMAQIKANPGQTFPFVMEMTGYDKILSFLSTLESEHLADTRKISPKDIEEAAWGYASKECEKAAFIAGAKWQKEQMMKEQADLFTIVALDAAQRAKEQMMKEAVEADVNIYRDLVAGKSWAEFVVEMPVNNLGDKAKVIIVKED